ncbi:MAG: helix-turn-helix transcriptional regulator [Alphaproteobacteria bacterium]|nr:helix-turn-helix transcriptional regulator [Alphaproteobacteria bacterium]
MTPDICRAGRAILNWSQERLAVAAGVSIGTVRNFEIGRTSPTKGNLRSLEDVLFENGVSIMVENDGGAGIILNKIKLRAHVPGDGYNFEIKYVDLDLVGPDSDSTLWFKIPEEILIKLFGKFDNDMMLREKLLKSQASIVGAVRKWVAANGLGSRGAGPRVIDLSYFP